MYLQVEYLIISQITTMNYVWISGNKIDYLQSII